MVSIFPISGAESKKKAADAAVPKKRGRPAKTVKAAVVVEDKEGDEMKEQEEESADGQCLACRLSLFL